MVTAVGLRNCHWRVVQHPSLRREAWGYPSREGEMREKKDAVSRAAYSFTEDLGSVSQNSHSRADKYILRKPECNVTLLVIVPCCSRCDLCTRKNIPNHCKINSNISRHRFTVSNIGGRCMVGLK